MNTIQIIYLIEGIFITIMMVYYLFNSFRLQFVNGMKMSAIDHLCRLLIIVIVFGVWYFFFAVVV